MKYKSFIAKVAIIFILALSFINSYNKTSNFVYADTTTDQWETVTTNNELSDAFRYYCKSRNLAIEGSLLDALTTFTTNDFNVICNTLGIDVTALQAHLKRSTDSNNRVQFLFDQFGITAYNRIFAEFLQNNDLEVGDSVNDKNLYSGSLFVTDTGESCLIYVVNFSSDSATASFKGNKSAIIQYGTQITDCSDVATGTFKNYSYTINDNVYSGNLSKLNNMSNGLGVSCNTSGNLTYKSTYDRYWAFIRSDASYMYGGITVLKTQGDIYIGAIGINAGWNTPDMTQYNFRGIKINSNNNLTDNVNIYATTNNNTINNNNYEENNQTVINQNGDVYNYDYDDDDPPVNPPSGGGGGSGGDTTNVNIDFPNFDFNIPDIDFSLKGLTEKFPFCIPFDMVALLTLLNAEPQAPRIQGQIPFGSFFTWNLDLDFSRFDDFAVIMRGLEFVGFIFFLIGATINIAKG